MDFLTEHWLSVGVGVFWAVYGAVWALQGPGAYCGDNVGPDFEPCCNARGHAVCHGSVER